MFSHLGIEWVSAELENALKLVSVGLPHCQGVLATLEDLNLVQSVQGIGLKNVKNGLKEISCASLSH